MLNILSEASRMTNLKSTSIDTSVSNTPSRSLPTAIYVLSFGIFAMVTSEFQVSGMINVMAADLAVSISQIGYLVAWYACAMAFGGPLLTILLLSKPPKVALLILFVVFIISETLGAFSHNYQSLVVARLITGAVSGAFFGTAIAICVQLVTDERRGFAISIVLAGIMIGTVIGLPMANLIGVYLGWRESFGITAVLALIGGVISVIILPNVPKQLSISLADELSAFKNPKLWAVFSTSLLIIGATFAAFTYFTPILKSLSGFSDTSIASLLLIYGLATVIGNTIVGRLADKHTLSTLAVGLIFLILFLLLFALQPENKVVATIALIGVGFVGVTMNPAMVSRVMRTANGRPLVNTVHTSVITLGTVTGSFLGGAFLSSGYGLAAPLWVGCGMAFLGFLSLLPELVLKRKPNVNLNTTD
jgi:DHA1 family inner membrane transport protein